MLETEEVDIDYFTPASGTSLAKIFSSNPQADETDKTSLKYIPPLPTQLETRSEDSKPTQCIYASALYAYGAWLKDSYISKERVGFAIIKILKTGIHNIILYDSNKTTLSCLTLTPKVKIMTEDNVSISYYDNQRKYWNVYTNPQEYKNIFEILQSLNVPLEGSMEVEKDFIENRDMKNDDIQAISAIAKSSKEEKKSDTDSSVNRKTKDSIIKRMATMGQSVLPPSNLNAVQTSDSSDSNEPHNLHKTRHKLVRTANKRHIEKNLLEFENDSESQINKITTKLTSHDVAGKSCKNNNQQIVPINTMDILKSTFNVSEETDINILIAEQRVSNSELRVNMNRLTDKVDILLDKVKDIRDNNINRNCASNSSSNFHNEIVYKLLNEYEKKINYYEGILKGLDCNSLNQVDISNKREQEAQAHVESTSKVELIEEKEIEINDLKKQIKTLSNKLNEQEQLNSSNNSILKEVDYLKDNLTVKDNEIIKLNNKLENLLLINKNNNDISNKIKEIMNDTFQTISANFDNEQNYTGAAIKSIVASIIKKTTMDCLKDT